MSGFVLAASALAMLGVLLELRAARREQITLYALRPTLSNLGCGALRAISALALQGTLVGLYAAIHERWALVPFEAFGALGWLLAFVAYDFSYYWVHRLSHAMPLLWAAHSVHHQPSELDLSVLFRAPIVAPLQAFPLYALLAVLGVPPTIYVAIAVLEHALMFWLHTRFVPTLGRVGWLLNTPSHHRVHHGARAAESQANYGGVLIIWDRAFGTFRAETRVPSFGIEGRAPPLCPLRANLLPWLELVQSCVRAHGLRARLAALFGQGLSRSASKPLPGT